MVSRFVQHNNDLKQQHSNTSSQNKPDFGKTDQDHISGSVAIEVLFTHSLT